MTPIKDVKGYTVTEIETYVNKYVSFTDDYSLPIALWIMCTYIFPTFDAFPYVVITSETKRSGKSRLAEMMSFASSNPRMFGSVSPGSLYWLIEQEHPTMFFDEAEDLSSEAAGAMRSMLNVGYRKGQKVPRRKGDMVVEYDTYCPKVFILIGDVYDTLRDRSIIIRMMRSDAPARFTYEAAKAEGAALRDVIAPMVNDNLVDIESAYLGHKGIEFLTDRDEEIWTPLFAMCKVMCPSRLAELSRIAVDMATEKTQPKKRYVDMDGIENAIQMDEYTLRLLGDLLSVMSGKNCTSQDAVKRLRDLPTAPWRKFRGDGITMHNIADLLSKFGVRPDTIRIGAKVAKGYKYSMVKDAASKHIK